MTLHRCFLSPLVLMLLVLATAHSEETGKDEPVIWINDYRGVRVFGISLGYHNETIEADTWQSVVAAGGKWAMNKPPANKQ
jgi:type 1 glutamine amidotransferase